MTYEMLISGDAFGPGGSFGSVDVIESHVSPYKTGVIPEPFSVILFGTVLAGAAAATRRRER